VEPHFHDFEYPMWDNANYFTGAMRVTGFVCSAGEALVWEGLVTGLGDAGLRREVTVHAAFPLPRAWCVHTEAILAEDAVSAWAGGAPSRVFVPKLAAKVSLDIDGTGLSKQDQALLGKTLGPSARLLVRLGQRPYRAKVFASAKQLAREAGLPAGARLLFSFDDFLLPTACEPASSAPDIVAMVDALAAHTRIAKLPSHPLHPLHGLLDRCRTLGGWDG
jgi:hypothetical protein